MENAPELSGCGIPGFGGGAERRVQDAQAVLVFLEQHTILFANASVSAEPAGDKVRLTCRACAEQWTIDSSHGPSESDLECRRGHCNSAAVHGTGMGPHRG
jgi:hypothetical protein